MLWKLNKSNRLAQVLLTAALGVGVWLVANSTALAKAPVASLQQESDAAEPSDTPADYAPTELSADAQRSAKAIKAEAAPQLANAPLLIAPRLASDKEEELRAAFELPLVATNEQSTASSKNPPIDLGLILASHAEQAAALADSEAGSKPFYLSVATLERIAAEAKSAHQLARLIEHCEALLRSGALSADELVRGQRVTAWAYHARAAKYLEQQDEQNALRCYDCALSHQPNYRPTLVARAVCYAQHGQPEAALTDLDRAIQLVPQEPTARRNRAAVRFQVGDAEGAVEDCSYLISHQLIKRPAEQAACFELRGLAYQQLGQLDAAAIDLDIASKHDPNRPGLQTRRGMLYAQQADDQAAAAALLQALEQKPNDAIACRCLAWVLATTPDKSLRSGTTAVAAAQRALGLVEQPDAVLLEATAAAHATAGDFPQAVRYQRRAVLAAEGANATAAARRRLALYQSSRIYTR